MATGFQTFSSGYRRVLGTWARPSFSQGPTGPSSGDQTPYQIANGGRQQWGAKAYGLHGKRFNYLFFDGHVGIHKITDTVGTGTTNAPRGMWTMTAGD